ncbi:TauD/TfdA family dioxygenase [Pseudomonas sp. BIGb0164]|uniref:TauD/TfdA family dioxygenase n=1 Tax=Pseudomonas sp. BIGb0164 TaxID=2940605 RepID=UPI00216796E2|nr:TauD/TfdA family dioxygenase [Pseudomonas sp. BIGb0164]MCS4249424.1 hypothetical protein [Pseudomonas sp. BIGb0164]
MPRKGTTHHFRLTTREKELLKKALSDIPYTPEHSEHQIEKLRRTAHTLFPDRLITKLESLKRNNTSYCIFENLPIDDVMGSPTDTTQEYKIKSGNLTENILLAFGSFIAEPYSTSFEGTKIVNDLTPRCTSAMDYTGLGSEVELDFHIENAAQIYDVRGDTSPLALLLLGVRKDPKKAGPKTLISDARDALEKMSPEEINVLYSNSFAIKKPFRWRDKSKPDQTPPSAILSGPINLPRVAVAFYADMVSPLNKSAELAYNAFQKQIKLAAKSVDITPGCLVFINNRFTLHAREKFKATYDKNGMPYRWIQRVFITNNLWAFRHLKEHKNRIFDPSQTYDSPATKEQE